MLALAVVTLAVLAYASLSLQPFNNRTQIVGWSDTAFNTSRAFLWEDGTLTDIGTFGGDAGFSIANAINDR